MKKVIKLILLTFISIFALNTKVFAASATLSVSSTKVNVNDSFTVTVNVTSAAAWQIKTSVTGPATGCVINESNVTEDAKDTNKTFTANCKATGVGTITISLTGNVSSAAEDNYVNVSGTKTVTVKEISSNNNLYFLKVDNVSVPDFDALTTKYTINVDKEEVNITAQVADPSASVSGTGKKTLKYGKNQYDIKVTAENGNVKTYTIIINRNDNRDTNNFLSSLTVDKGTLTFNKNTTSYKVNVDTDVDKITINATTESQKAKIDANSIGIKNLKLGDNKFEIKVTAENGNVKTYTIVINRKDNRDSNNYLSNLSVDKGTLTFDKNITSYNVNVENDVDKITINATTDSDKAKVTGTGEKTLKVGKNKFEIKVTAENETVKTYTITVTRADKEEVNKEKLIKSLTIDNVELNFDPNVYNYSISVGNQENLNFNYELESGVTATIVGNEFLKNNSIVILKLTKENITQEYVFNVYKPEEQSTKPTTTIGNDSNNKKKINWIIYVVIGVVLLGLIGFLAKKKDKKNPNKDQKIDETPIPDVSEPLTNDATTNNNPVDNVEKLDL